MRLLATIAVMLCSVSPVLAQQSSAERPNIILIMTDDMGFSDLGCYGSEIDTPVLDGLAMNGLRFTQFYNTSRCCPTRATLLTGLYSHQAGIGGMTFDQGPENPGYRGHLNEHCVTIAEALSPAGYFTIQTGKWHVGDKEQAWWPLGRGFDRCFSCPSGGGFYFAPSLATGSREVVRGNEILFDAKQDPPADWYTTDAWTDEGLAYLKEAVDSKKPFFWYLAYNAPHWPLQAKPQDIAKYRGKYKIGWDAVRENRYSRLIDLGIIDADWKLSPRGKAVPAWDTLSARERGIQDLRMATYAAMIDCVDQNIGKIVSTLKELQIYDNTLILFLCDNGGSAEGGIIGSNNREGRCGTRESFAKYGECWANVSDTPFRKYKKFIHEGGISSPLIAHWPRGIDAKLQGSLVSEPAHLIDLMATCVDVSAAEYPETFKGARILPMEGKSLQPLFHGKELQRQSPLFFEHMGNKGVRQGRWKLVAFAGKPWELYDLQIDRTELNDLSAKFPERVEEMTAQWEAWAKRCHVNKARKKK